MTDMELIKQEIKDIHKAMEDHNVKHEVDMAEVREHIVRVTPILEGLQGAKILGTGLKWLAGVGVAWFALRAIFTGNPLP